MDFRSMFGAAEWVSLPEKDADSMLFRAAFAADHPLSATLAVVGLGVFEAYINGQAVSGDRFLPLNSDYAHRDFLVNGEPFGEITAHRLYVPEYDVTHLLRAGENVLAVMTGRGWFAENKLYPFGKERMCFALTLTYADGSVRRIVSGPDVRVRTGFVTEGHLRTGETQDFRGYDDGWMTAGYDDSDWARAEILPPLETEYLTSDCPPDRVIRRIVPAPVWEKDGVSMWDCGENITGTPVLICRAAAGEEIAVRVAERLDENGNLHEKHMHRQELHVISDGTPRHLRLYFTWFGFRYVEITGKAELSHVQVIHTDAAVTSSFDCDNSTLRWLYNAYLRTQLGNMHMGIPSDCPHIERCGYTGDGQLTCEAAMTMLDTQAFFRKWIGDISDCQDRLSGHVQYTAPYVRCGGGPGGWGCAIVEVPYQFMKHYGDSEPAVQLYPQMLRYFDYLDAHSENDLVISDRPGEWCLGDWCTPEKIRLPEPYVNTYFYIKSLRRVMDIAPIAGRQSDLPMLEAKITRLSARLTETYFDPATGDFCGNDQGANAFAVDIGLGDERTYRNMAEHYRESGCYDTGIFGTDIVTRLLFEHGDSDIAAALLCRHTVNGSYGHMEDLGCTTILEYWGDYARSDNHPMFGAPVRYLHQYILGIRQAADSIGWRHAEIRPAFVPQLGRASGSITTVRGKIGVSWEKRGGKILVRADIPDGMCAELVIGEERRTLGAGENLIEIG